VIREDDPGSGESKVIRHVLRSYLVNSKPIPNKYDDSSRCGPCVLLSCSKTTC
jgi:hypothetical protein